MVSKENRSHLHDSGPASFRTGVDEVSVTCHSFFPLFFRGESSITERHHRAFVANVISMCVLRDLLHYNV